MSNLNPPHIIQAKTQTKEDLYIRIALKNGDNKPKKRWMKANPKLLNIIHDIPIPPHNRIVIQPEPQPVKYMQQSQTQSFKNVENILYYIIVALLFIICLLSFNL